MASLWALMGVLDARPVQDGRVADVVNDYSKVAEVTVRGTLNSKPFIVKRSKNMLSGSSLSFALDGRDLTLQSTSDTQKLINEHFAHEPQLLMRSIFHGQHSVGNLLESSDAKLKDELSSLLSLDIWQKSASLARFKHRELHKKVSELDGMLQLRRKDAERALDKRRLAEDEMNSRKVAIDNSLLESGLDISQLDLHDLEVSISAVQTELSKSVADISQIENELYNLTAADSDRLTSLQSQLNTLKCIQNQLENDLQHSVRHFDTKKERLSSLENQLNALAAEWDFNDSNQPISPDGGICKTCGQTIKSIETMEYLRQSASSKYDALESQIQHVKEELSSAELIKQHTEKDLAVILDKVDVQRNLLRKEEESLALQSRGLRDQLKDSRLIQTHQAAEYSRLMKQY
jgi:DNA repair exonuclease SbcCD ATPase subunit